MTYYKRIIDKKLLEWKASQRRKPLLIRGARQVGKSSAVRHFGKEFKYFVEINLESQPSIRGLFSKDIDVHRTCESISATTRGSMQSLWLFMRKKALHHAVRTSLENFGEFEYVDKESQDAIRHVDVFPLYAMSNLCKLSVDTEMKIATP